jgi:hypothetical protein
MIAMTYRGVEACLPSPLTFGIRWRWVVNIKSRLLHHRRNSHGYPLDWRLDVRPRWEFRIRFSGHPARSHCTEWAARLTWYTPSYALRKGPSFQYVVSETRIDYIGFISAAKTGVYVYNRVYWDQVTSVATRVNLMANSAFAVRHWRIG